MKTEKELKQGILELKKQLSNKLLPKMAHQKIKESIILLEWVLK